MDRIFDNVQCNEPDKSEYEEKEQLDEEVTRWKELKKEAEMLEKIKQELWDASREDLQTMYKSYRRNYKVGYEKFNHWVNCIINCTKDKFSFPDLYFNNEDMADDWSNDMLGRSITLNGHGVLEEENQRDAEEIINNYTIVEPSYIITHYHNSVKSNITLRESYEIADNIGIMVGFDISSLNEKEDKKEET